MNALAANSSYGNGSVLWWMLEFFLFVIWFWLLIAIFSDLFRDHDASGGEKALWVILLVILPFIGICIYLIVRGRGMNERAQKASERAQAEMDARIRATVSASSTSSADQIAKAKALLDAGSITQAEFDQLKAKALAS